MSNLGNEESGNCISLKTNIASTEENSPHILHLPPMASCPVYCYLDQYISTFMSFILFLSVFTVIETLKISKFQNIQDISHPNLINNFSSESSANILDESCLGRLSSYSQISQNTWKESLSGVDKLVQNAKVFTPEITPLTQPFTPPQLLLNHLAKTFTPSPKSGLNPMAKCFTTSSDVALNPSAKPFSYQIVSNNTNHQNPISGIIPSTETYLQDKDSIDNRLSGSPLLSKLSEISKIVYMLKLDPNARTFIPLINNVTPIEMNAKSNLNDLSNCLEASGNRAPLPLLNCLARLNTLTKPFFTTVLNPNAQPFTAEFVTLDRSGSVDSDLDSLSPSMNFSKIEQDEEEGTAYVALCNLRVKSIDKILFGHININSIRNKFEPLVDIVKDKLDIILISETKIDNTFPKSQFEIQGYSPPFRLDRNAHGGGLLFYARSDIPCKSLPLVSENIECVISEITISKKKWLTLGIYNPDVKTITKHLSAVEKNLDHYLPYYDNVIIFGDFNCEMTEETLANFCSLYNLKCLIKEPTCFKNAENPSCIDLILTNRPRCFQNSSVIETGLSDFHKLTITVLKTSFRKMPPKIIKYRDYKKFSPENFHQELCTLNLYNTSNDCFVSQVMEILNSHAPLKQKYVRANDNPFITKALRKEHMKRSNLRNIYLKDRTEENHSAFKLQRNKCVSLLRKTKKSYFGNLKSSDVCENKKFWKSVKPLFNEQAVSTDAITLIEDNIMVNDDAKVSEIFNEFFGNAVKSMNIPPYVSSPENRILSDDPIQNIIGKYKDHPSILKISELIPRESLFSFKPTNIETMMKEISNLNTAKSCPIDTIPSKILKDNSSIFGPKILIDFNHCIENGIFPSNQKCADITPIFKKLDKYSKNNYRQVSILPAISKIFERLMFYQINQYMQDKLSIFLCGFRKGMSTQNCLLFMVEKWRRHLDKSEKAGVLLTDLSKAFDCLWHDLLVAKLHAYGFDHHSLKLIYSYLNDRFQRVRINASFSSWVKIFFGVPQGSILGPPLFNIYSNDLFLFLILDIANYADDNSPFACGKNVPSVISQLEIDASALLNWIGNNGLKANPDKFHLLLSEKNKDLAIRVDTFDIKNSNSEKLLGIKIDNKLTFDPHVSDICAKVSQKLHALSRIGHLMKFNRRKEIVNAFILSQFGYCPLVWMFHSRKLNHRINNLHKRALCIVYQDDKLSFEELLAKDASFTIHERNIQTLAIELYKVWYSLSPKIMELVFPLDPGKNSFLSRNIRTVNQGTETLAYLGPKIWSLIPEDWKQLSLSKFSKKIRMWRTNECPCRICKLYIQGVGFIDKSSISNGII